MKTTKLLLVCGTLESGGAERVISILSTPFADNFNEVTILMWREAPVFYDIDRRIKLISLPKLANSDNSFKKIAAFRHFVKKYRPCIILSFLTLFNLLTLLSLSGIKIPIIVAERNDPKFIKGGKLVKVFRDLLYRRAKGVLCQTESIKKYFRGCLSGKTYVIYNPVILSQDMIGCALNTKKINRIVSVGRLHPQKNHKLLIDAFKIFHNSHPDYTLTIYGKGELKATLNEYIDNIGMSDYIELAGEKENVKELILNSKIFVMTSCYEGMPNALIEAMCLGLPCISTRVSGAEDLISNGVNGLLVNNDSKEISEKISVIADNEEFARKIGNEAIKLYDLLKVQNISGIWIKYINSKIR